MEYTKLKAKMVERKVTSASLAKSIGISRFSLSNKIRGNTSFTLPEINAIAKFLNLDFSDIKNIFLDQT